MKAITLTQPWATLMIARRLDTGVPSKRIESRSWTITEADAKAGGSDTVGGMRLGLHAGKNCPREIRPAISNGTVLHKPYAVALLAAGYSPLDPWAPEYAERVERTNAAGEWDKEALRDITGVVNPPEILRPLPLASMLGIITIHKILTGTRVLELYEEGKVSALEISLGSYSELAEKRFGWVTSNATELPTPIPTRGYQKLWQIPDDVMAQMREAGHVMTHET